MMLCLALFTLALTGSTIVSASQKCPGTSGLCCKDSETCCPSGCCPDTPSTCCNDGTCCKASSPVCCNNGKCCTASSPICCPKGCCPSGTTCCGDNQCCRVSGKLTQPHPLMEQVVKASLAIPNKNKNDRSTDRSNEHIITKQIIDLGTCFKYDRLKLNENYSLCMYHDSKGIPTIGVGFNLKRSDARAKITDVGANYDKLLNGTQCLNDNQVQQLLEGDVNTAVTCARSFVSNWNQLGSGPQSALADMAFNMGCGGLNGLVCFKNAVYRGDFAWAVEEMKDSKWCKVDVPLRCSRDVSCMSG